MSQKLPASNFEWIKGTSQYFIKNYNEEFDEGYFLEVCHPHRKFKTGIKSWISFEKSS